MVAPLALKKTSREGEDVMSEEIRPVPSMGEGWAINESRTRAAGLMPFGIALYEGQEVDGEFTGQHIGVTGENAHAIAWLSEGITPPDLMTIHRDPP